MIGHFPSKSKLFFFMWQMIKEKWRKTFSGEEVNCRDRKVIKSKPCHTCPNWPPSQFHSNGFTQTRTKLFNVIPSRFHSWTRIGKFFVHCIDLSDHLRGQLQVAWVDNLLELPRLSRPKHGTRHQRMPQNKRCNRCTCTNLTNGGNPQYYAKG